MDKITIDSRGFVYIDGVKCFQINGHKLVFYDRNRKRSQDRGAPLVEVDVLDLVRLVSRPVGA